MVVALTIVRYPKIYIPIAIIAMAVHRIPLLLQARCSFWKLLGCGKNGSFDLQPDLQQWGLLSVWDSQEDFDLFYSRSFVSRWWRAFTEEQWTVFCSPLETRGKWDEKEPFKPVVADDDYDGPVAVLTRATIRLSRIKRFWSNVGRVSDLMSSADGYVFSLGIGEAPVFKQATFSVWRSAKEMKLFAYSSAEHLDVIKKTRNENWYSEELFARFKPVGSFGSLKGRDPLKEFLNS
ncbi:spheroidene monooxygenase [Arcticibacter tournemirensis]|uniref:DUF3291 domain-containing protein n=2 Tax=Arcticibacter tournemirensis TaxID=699437 RepID=A0A4Q0MG69_9SPHI|nr:DUF3291 domain-containing protein [Arcticibacter tournemirensis]KAA8477140.1 DUF3291 domain-containing protein [Arcticibacter tournemirensis]RXF72335.1 DUF3291 domain-containing protein [Arcticibacter tournemirensis]TQM51214.1 spheroidene monooxygenase [Arcticibacter tournemirensis]